MNKKKDMGAKVLALLRVIKKEEDKKHYSDPANFRTIARSAMADEIYGKVKALLKEEATKA